MSSTDFLSVDSQNLAWFVLHCDVHAKQWHTEVGVECHGGQFCSNSDIALYKKKEEKNKYLFDLLKSHV